MKFNVNEYACVVYTSGAEVHMVDGTIVAVGADSITLDVDNVRGPSTRTKIPLCSIDDRIA